jgi:collagenase-like PrtC family protease
MKFTVGYQYSDPGEESFTDIVLDFKASVGEVYFAWMDQPSARSPAASASGLTEWESKEIIEKELIRLKEAGIKLNLLLNANCHGSKSLSRELANDVCALVSWLKDKTGLDTVTTTSLMLAETVKKHFPDIEIRASVNMRVGTVQGMDYVRDIFDGFCVQKECNRDLARLERTRAWAEANGKKICLLANSGCLNYCSAQIFHDNIVAHLKEINEVKSLAGYNPVLCQRHYSDPANRPSILKNSSWIRPEDIKIYEPFCHLIKLATRTHENPRQVIHAYTSGKFSGNLLDLTEPGHGMLFKGYILDNTLLPADWQKKVSSCDKVCEKCGYCDNVLKDALVKAE